MTAALALSIDSLASHAPAASPNVNIESEVLGSIAVDPGAILNFAQGVLGFPDCRTFALIPSGRDGFFWLQSTEFPSLSFLLADPFMFFDGYSVDVALPDLTDLDAKTSSDVAILGIVTLPRERDEAPTVNLQGPLAINLRTQRGKQMVLPESDFGVRSPLDLGRTESATR
jgi:flagellar assembly factor FliW